MKLTNNSMIEICAHAAYDANCLLSKALCGMSQPTWADAPEWQRKDAIERAEFALSGASLEQEHEAWCASKIADGWTHGVDADADATKKTHELLVPWEQLSALKKARSSLFQDTVRSTYAALMPVRKIVYDRVKIISSMSRAK